MSDDDVTPMLLPTVDVSEWSRPQLTDDELAWPVAEDEPARPVTAEYPVVAAATETLPAAAAPATTVYRDMYEPRREHRQTAPVGRQTQRRPRRRHSSPVLLRVLCGLAAVVAAAGAALLMLTDRAPSVVLTMFGDRATDLWLRIDARSDVIDTPPPADTVVHIAVWATLMALIGIAMWSIWGLISVAMLAAITSVGVEFAQERYTATRAMELRDVMANMVGIAVGVGATILVMLIWRLVTMAWRSVVR